MRDESTPCDDAERGELHDIGRLVAVARAVVLSCMPFVSAWEFEHNVDAESIHRELREALGISHREWRHLALGYPLEKPDGHGKLLRCENCNREFWRPTRRGPTPRYCGGACRQAAFRARHPERDAAEVSYAIRRADGQDLGEFSFLVVSDGDWSPAEDDAYGIDDQTEYEMVRMTVEVVERRVYPRCSEAGCHAPSTHWGLCEQHAREDDPEAFDD